MAHYTMGVYKYILTPPKKTQRIYTIHVGDLK